MCSVEPLPENLRIMNKSTTETSLFTFSSELPPEVDATVAFGNELIVINHVTINQLQEAPMQIGFFVMCLCTKGEGHFTLGGEDRTMRADDLLVFFGEQTFQNISCSDDFEAKVVLMSRSFAQDCIIGLDYLWPYLIYVMANPIIHLGHDEQRWMIECRNLLVRRLHDGAKARFLRETVVSLMRAFYFELCSLLDFRQDIPSASKQNRSYSIFDKFIRLLSENFKNERCVEWYSNEMCLTPKHLSEVVKNVSGRTAGQWITTFVLVETKTLLKNSTLSIKEIAQEMNFPNQSFLGKYFKNVTGMSPSDYRHLVMQ